MLPFAVSAQSASDLDCPGPGCPPQPIYRWQDIEKHFAASGRTCGEGEICLPSGETRGVCIGTIEECSSTVRTAAGPGEFDLILTFELGSDRLTPQAETNLVELAKALQSQSLNGRRVEIAGHTDARGSAALNRRLSEERAEAVARFLAGQGVNADRLVVRGYGESQPRTDDPNDPVNRRVTASLLDR